MPYRLTGVGTSVVSAQWEKVPGDEDVARRVLIVLEDRRLLFGQRHMEDESECVASALAIREMLTRELQEAKPGKDLALSLRSMRGACRRFVDAGGPGGHEFRGSWSGNPVFWTALGELRALMGQQIGLIADKYEIDLEPELASIIPVEPEQDLSWVPGFGDGQDSDIPS
ncbi:MAG TPA: DUF6650 family protein [Anaerolineales bacterium]|nr:DUF6650 family protein [Anaerolineales bacterium]